jgi:hypothetical protein
LLLQVSRKLAVVLLQQLMKQRKQRQQLNRWRDCPLKRAFRFSGTRVIIFRL